jgi:hypothetical protein
VRTLSELSHSGTENERTFAVAWLKSYGSERRADSGWRRAENQWEKTVQRFMKDRSCRDRLDLAEASAIALLSAELKIGFEMVEAEGWQQRSGGGLEPPRN